MEPTPPPPNAGSGSSPLRLHPRGPVPSLSWDLSLVQPPFPSPNQQNQQRRHQAKVSPRHVKLQSVHAPASLSLPVYAATAFRDQLSGQFRNELFQFHQLLQDAQARCGGHNRQGTQEHLLASEMESSRAVLDVITSDRHVAVMKEFFHQWQRVKSTHGRQDVHEQELLHEVVESIFRNLPTILTEADVRNAKSFMRYIDALKALRELILGLLYKADDSSNIAGGESDDDADSAVIASPSSALFASTAALLEALGGAKAKPTLVPLSPRSSTRPKRVPLYLYCQQLERELEVLRRRLRNLRAGDDAGSDDLGLLSDQTMSLLLQFWELPKLQRLAFFCQVASQGRTEDCDTVLQVFVERCSSDRLLSVWDTLQLTPHVQQALALRKHGDDAEAAAREAAEALAAANEERKQLHDGDSSNDDDDEDDDAYDDSTSRVRKGGKGYSAAARGSHRPSQRQVDLSGLAGVFEEDDDDSDGDAGGDGWSQNGRGKRRRHKIRIRDRGRTPEGQRGHHHSSHHGHQRQHHSKHDESRRSSRITNTNEDNKARPGSRGRETTKPTTPKPVLDRTHANLLELVNADDASVDRAVVDAAWKLVELIDRNKNKSTIVPRGVVHAAPTQQNTGGVGIRRASEDAFGSNLTTDQQFEVKIDQLQSLLTSLGSVSLHTMTNETISSAFKRLPGLHRLFQNFSGKAYHAVGLEASVATTAFPIPSMPLHLSPTPSQSDGSVHTRAASAAVVPALWGEDHVLDSVEVMLGKLGKMVRSLAPIADVRSGAGSDSDGSNTASLEILKLAEAMEEIVSGGDPTDEGGGDKSQGRRRLSLEPSKRLAILSRLKSLAQGNQIENLTGLLASTCDDLVTLKTVNEHQQQQLELFSESQSADTHSRKKAPRLVDADSESGLISEDESGTAAVDDFIRSARKAKIRRASAAKMTTTSNTSGSAKDDVDDDDDDGYSSMTASRFANRLDIPQNIKQATAQRGSKLFHVSILLRVVDQMYRENYETMLSTLQYGSRRMEFSEFMYDWHIRKYGLKSLAQQHLLKLIQSLRKYERKVFQCQLCLRFLGIVNGLGYHEHKFVLGLLDKWSFGTFSAASKHRIEHAPRQFKIRVTFAISTIQDALNERFGVYFRTMDAVSARIKAQAMRHDEEFVKEADLLTIAIDEWLAQRQRIEQILEAVYVAGDVNGDGSLEYDEFSAVISHLSPSLDDKFLQRVFTAAHDYMKPRRISFARFLDVILLERVLNTSSQSGKSKQSGSNADRRDPVSSTASTSSSGASTSGETGSSARLSAEEEETYQFDLLAETWEQDREIVAQSLSAITHHQTVATIQFRVSFLTQILNKRVDSKTAWMCHRQIMREISRFQNMNEDQIVAVKKKEETFKKAVLAIRNLQRMSQTFKLAALSERLVATESQMNGSEPRSQDDDGSSASSPDTKASTHLHDLHKQSSYVSVVEGALSAADSCSPSSLAQMEALEDQLREKFLARADEGAIDDFKNALQTIRRMSLQAFPHDLDLEQLRAKQSLQKTQRERASVGSLGGAVYEDGEEDEDEDDAEGDDDDES